MPIEIERKFLLKNNSWLEQVSHSSRIRQGYFAHPDSNNAAKASLRVRIEDEKANINIKSATAGMRRMEFEYPVPVDEAIEMLDQLCETPQIDKTRHHIKMGQHVWEIDEFFGENQGLMMAEIELSTENEVFEIPDWLGKEVTEDIRYYNVYLVKHPFKNW